MRIIRGLHNIRPEHRGCVATIGNFDGVHTGHKSLISRLKVEAAKLDLPVTVVIFEPQPREYFDPVSAPGRITRFADKVSQLAKAGVEQVVCLSFNDRLRALTADEFVQTLLLDGLGVKFLVVGDDFRFGCDRSGDFEFLKQVSGDHDFELVSMDTFSHQQERVSSTLVREVLNNADFDLAERLLGWRYAISGKVVHGQKLGRQLGVPTANIQLSNLKSPFNGVFAVKVSSCDDEQISRFEAVANLGVKPTVNGIAPSLEVHIIDGRFQPEVDGLYGTKLNIEFCHKLRNEQKFDGIEALKAQIEQDIADAATWFASQG